MSEGRYQLLPQLSDAQYEALKSDIAENGVLVPVELDEDGNILDGFHRVKACKELEKDWPSITRFGLTEQEKRTHARRVNMNRRHLSAEQKREQIKAQLRDTPEWSNNRIAGALGVADMTVASARSAMEASGELPKLGSRQGADGKLRPSEMPKTEEHPEQPTMAGIFAADAKGAEEVRKVIEKSEGESGIAQAAQQEVEKMSKGETTPKAATEAIEKATTEQAVNVVAFSSETNEYYTPSEYIEAARSVMGGIDLDPASHPKAQQTIKAAKYFAEADDGLSQEWIGRVWLNPPYGKTGSESNQGLWAQRLIDQHQNGNATEGIVLVRAAVGYDWFEKLWDALPVCFARKRLSFTKSDGTDDGQSKQGTAFFYVGPDPTRFIEVFRQFGRVILPEAQL